MMQVGCPVCGKPLATSLRERPLQGDSLVLLLSLSDEAVQHIRCHFDGGDGEPMPVEEVA